MSMIRNSVFVVLAFAVLCSASVSCNRAHESGANSVERLSKTDLEKIKQAAISYLKDKKPLNWEIHLAEIERGAPLDLEHEQRIGRWIVTVEPDSVTLVRDADVAPEVRRFGMVFVKKNGDYVVTRDFWERESFH
jgi:hypothetical protein